MGNYSYICPYCKKNIRDREVAHLKHVRHGKVLGETVGYYNGYGSVSGGMFAPYDIDFNRDNDDINSLKEINKSCFMLPDSKECELRLYEGEFYTWMSLRKKFGYTDIKEYPPESFYELWRSLGEYKPKKVASGISAYHEYCYRQADEAERSKNKLSRQDPAQGCGAARDVYKNLE